MRINLNDRSYQFSDENGARFNGNFKNHEIKEDKSPAALDAKCRAKYRKDLGDAAGDAAYEKERAELQTKLEGQGMSFSDDSGVPKADGSKISSRKPTLFELKGIEVAMQHFRDPGLPKLKNNVKFNFINETSDNTLAYYRRGTNDIFVLPSSSESSNCFQADNPVAYREGNDSLSMSYESIIAHEYVHLLEYSILQDPNQSRKYLNAFGVDKFYDKTTDSQTEGLIGKDGYRYRTLETGTGKTTYACTIKIGKDGKPSLDVKTDGADLQYRYQRVDVNGQAFGPYLTASEMKDQAWLRPSSKYITYQHPCTEARTNMVLGGLSRDYLYLNSDVYEAAKIQDQAYIGANNIRTWDGQIVPRTDAAIRAVKEREAELEKRKGKRA